MNPIIRGLTKEQVEQYEAKLNAVANAAVPGTTPAQINFDSSQGDILYFINGFFFIREFYRVYPEGPLMGQVMGFVNSKGEGRYGFEEKFDTELRGYSGRLRLERDSEGRLLSQQESIQGRDGTNFELSLDRNVQQFAESALAAQVKDAEAAGGTVIVMNPKNGEIIAMASTPGYDPNNYPAVAEQDIGLFDNPAISKQWEPGSIFKPLVMAAAIDQGLVTKDTRNKFGASVTIDTHVINTALNKAYGDESMTDVLVNSDNVAMVWVAEKLGNQRMSDYLNKFGFGQLTGVDLRNEITGSVLSVNQWRNINRATISFGQGIAVTPLQVITAYTAIANNGMMIRPHLVRAIIRGDGSKQEIEPMPGTQVIKPETAEQLRVMLASVVVKAHKRAGVDGYSIGGKTGTAQIPNPDGGGYIEDAYNHSFVGIGPTQDPRFIILTKIDKPNLKKVGRFAEGTAVPLFGKVANFLVHYYQIPPTNR